MSLADKKRSVMTTIGSYQSMMEQGDAALQTDLFTSVKSKKDEIIPYLLDVLKTVAGVESIKEVIGGMVGSLVDKLEPQLKTVLKKQLTPLNSGNPIPVELLNDGMTIPISNIDIKGKFKTSPTSADGNLIYGKATDSFDSTAYDAISAGGVKSFGNVSLEYLEGSDSFNIKLSGGTSISGFFSDYIDNTELLNKKEIITNITDSFYGTITKSLNKTSEQVYNELLIEQLLQQVLDGDNSFTVSDDMLDYLQNRALDLSSGEVNYDLGCGLMATSLDFNDFNSLVTNISGATDQYYIANELGATIDNSSSDDELTAENKETIRDSFFQKIINNFTLKTLEAVTTTPQVNMLLSVVSYIDNNGVIIYDGAVESIEKIKICVMCMAKEIMKIIAAYIFAIAVGYLISLIKPVVSRILKEKINQYAGVMSSLTGGINKLI